MILHGSVPLDVINVTNTIPTSTTSARTGTGGIPPSSSSLSSKSQRDDADDEAKLISILTSEHSSTTTTTTTIPNTYKYKKGQQQTKTTKKTKSSKAKKKVTNQDDRNNYKYIPETITNHHETNQVESDILDTNTSTTRTRNYIPAPVEQYLMDHVQELGYASDNDPSGCDIWKTPTKPSSLRHQHAQEQFFDKDHSSFQINDSVRTQFTQYRKALEDHTNAMKTFKPIPDLLESIQQTGTHDVCRKARLHPNGIEALFPFQSLSKTKSGFIEPLTPPMRHPNICFGTIDKYSVMDLNYLVHDFEAMCRNLKPTSKRILIDLGASLEFSDQTSPMLSLLQTYETFGFHFDHIYGFESNMTDPTLVYEELLPTKYFTNYHWINVGVSQTEGHKLNPLESLLKQFKEDDFIVLKLDIDTASIEVPLARQLLEDKDGVYHKLIDQFYFEHHVHMEELAPYWKETMEGTIKDTLDLFFGLRKKGIPAHYWP